MESVMKVRLHPGGHVFAQGFLAIVLYLIAGGEAESNQKAGVDFARDKGCVIPNMVKGLFTSARGTAKKRRLRYNFPALA